jgi:hypothetical protein
MGCGGGGSGGTPPPPAADFRVVVSPASIDVSQGATSTPITISVVSVNAFAGTVQVTLAGLPTGATSTPAGPFNIAAGANNSAALVIPANVPAGNFTVSATGTSGGLSHAANFNLRVQVVAPSATKTTYIRTDSIPVLDSVAGEPHHRHMAYDSTNKNLFVANRGMNRVEVLPTMNQGGKTRVDAPGASSSDISADGSVVWIGSAVEQIYAIDTKSLRIKARYTAGRFSPLPNTVFNRPIEVVSVSGGAYVRLRAAQSSLALLAFWDPLSDSWTDLTNTAPQLFQSGPGVIARSADHSRVFVAANDTSGEIALFDANGKIIVGPQTIGGGTILYAAANQDASRFAVVFASNANLQLLLLDGALNQIAARPLTAAHGLAFSPDGVALYASESSTAAPIVDVLDGLDLHLLGKISDFLVQGTSTELEISSESKILFGLSNRGISFVDAANPTQFSTSVPQFSTASMVQPAEGGTTGGLSVTLSGNNFEDGSKVIFGAVPASVVAVSGSTQIVATSPAAATTGPVNITVVSPSGWTLLAPDAFNYGPSISQILPNVVSSSGGDTIQIYGTGFGTDPSKVTVSFGGHAGSVQKVEDVSAIAASLGLDANYPFPVQRLTVLAPQATPGAGDVNITTPSGSTTFPIGFQFLQQSIQYPDSSLHKFILYDQKRQRLYLSSTDHIDVFDLTARAFLPALQPPGGPPPNAAIRGLALTPNSSQLIAADFGAQKLYIFNPDSGTGVAVAVGGVSGFLNSGPARVAATSTQSVFVAMSGEGGIGDCTNCLAQLDLAASPPVVQPAPQPEISILTGAPLIHADGTGDHVFLAFGAARGAPLAAWDAALPNAFATSPANTFTTDLTAASDGTLFSALADGLTEIRGTALTLVGYTVTAELARLAGRTIAPGGVLHPSGALLYQPHLDGLPPGSFPSSGLHGGIDVISARTGVLRLRIPLSDPPAMLSSDADGLHAGFLAIDETGQKIFAITASGLTVIRLAVVPLEVGTVSPAKIVTSGGTLVTIRGSGFVSGCTAAIGGKPASVIFVDMNTLKVTTPSVAAGPHELVLSKPGGESISWDAAITAE